MPIFNIAKTVATQLGLKRNGFGNEAMLRDLFAENLEALLGVRFLAKEYQTTDGRIDTLGIDENNAPVIIEYKWKEKEEVLSQGLFYLDWLKKNKPHFELLVDKLVGKATKVNWDRPRVVLIAQGFSRYVKAAAQQVDNVELITYSLYEGDVLHLESEYATVPMMTVGRKQRGSEADTKNVYSLEYHMGITSPEVRAHVTSLRDQVLQLPDVEEKQGQKTGITYRTTKSFARFEFRPTWVQVLVRAPVYAEDTQGLVKDISSNEWGYRGMIRFTPQTDLNAVFAVIKASYDSTL